MFPHKAFTVFRNYAAVAYLWQYKLKSIFYANSYSLAYSWTHSTY